MATLTLALGIALIPTAASHAATGGSQYGGSTASTTAKAPTVPAASTAPVASATPTVAGGQQFGAPNPAATPVVAGSVAMVLADGTAAAPALAPAAVQQAIWAANQLIGLPYAYGGGHRSFRSRAKGYDCSGTVSWALHGGDLLDVPMDSTDLMRYGGAGAGQWITIYTNPSHAYAVIAGLRLDTSAADDPTHAKGPRWRPLRRSSKGYHRRHPVGL
jgi:cell wall-associated NlpC family hydrolase